MRFNIFKSDLKRADLEHVYYYGECEKTLAYAEEKMSVDGVLEYYKKMKVEKNVYISDIDSIVNSEIESEEKEYLLLKKWVKVRQISAWTYISALIIGIIIWIVYGRINLALTIRELLVSLLEPAAFIIFVIAKIGETVCGRIYKRHTRNIMEKILAREKQFIALCQKYYKEIDDLYLYSLTPEHRELVLMRREMENRHNEMMHMEKRQYQELEHSRKTQEEILKTQKEILRVEGQRLEAEQEAVQELKWR